MQLTFSIEGHPAVLNRDWFTGRASLDVDGKTIPLASPFDIAEHWSFKLTRTWHVETLGHQIVIEKIRPAFVPGFRPQSYRVMVDGELVAEQTGY